VAGWQKASVGRNIVPRIIRFLGVELMTGRRAVRRPLPPRKTLNR
jgi:hypothetical protein